MPLLLSNLLTRVSSLTDPLTIKEESDQVLKANSFSKRASFIESQIQTIRCPKVVTAVACCPKKPRTRRINAGRPDCGEDAYFTLHTPSDQLGARILAMVGILLVNTFILWEITDLNLFIYINIYE